MHRKIVEMGAKNASVNETCSVEKDFIDSWPNHLDPRSEDECVDPLSTSLKVPASTNFERSECVCSLQLCFHDTNM